MIVAKISTIYNEYLTVKIFNKGNDLNYLNTSVGLIPINEIKKISFIRECEENENG